MDEWGTLVTRLSGFAFFVAAIVALVIRKWRMAGYLAAMAYILYFPIHLWFWQFELTERAPLPHWYFWSAVQQIVLGGIVPLIWFCFRRFRPMMTALFLVYVLSLLLQLFSYMYWAYGTTRNFTIRLSHLDSFYFALGTLTTAGTGNISAISETARGLQTLQMGLDLVLIGFVVALTLARYSDLLNRPPVGLPRHNAMTATPRPAADRRDQPQHASAPSPPCSDHPGTVLQGDTQDQQRRGTIMIKVHVLQVNTDRENIDELAAGVAAGHTDKDGWQMPKDSAPGDLVVWYAAGRQQYVARGWVEATPSRVEQGFGPFRGPAAGMQWIEAVDRKKVIKDCGLDGGRHGYQTVRDEIAVDFLRSVGLLV